jgi:hypothetical protein
LVHKYALVIHNRTLAGRGELTGGDPRLEEVNIWHVCAIGITRE